ncbi:MFS transporter [Planosporangium mesophilum]|uniref:MFS transporter n=1 Tax=Planosporangium mesophilum TaxID=689768 RepID=A0A8J3THF1_9ACTN|nr:MFS transporter [Planosporangium mesophilum]NJC86781.1 MFS transporter [Planosporangium mesophilum]GII25832.1 MFS transporter [Planosporangium mesophilum]
MAGGGLWRDRDFALLWTGQTVSEFGSMVTLIALPLVAVVGLRATPFEVGLVTAASSVAWLVVGLPAGVWVDRVRRRPLMIWADLGRAVALATVPAAWALDALTVGQLIGVAAITGLLTVLFDVAYPVYLPAVVGRDRLIEANGKLQASASVAGIGGPGLGGLLVQLAGAPFALLADAVSFVFSALTVVGVRAVEEVAHRSDRTSLRADLSDGLRYVLRHPFPRTLALAGATANFVFGGYEAVSFVFLAREVGLAGGLIGLLFGVGTAGGLVGALLANRLAGRFGDARVVTLAPAVSVVGGLLVPLTGRGAGLAWYLAGSLLVNASITVFNVCMRSAVQISTPPRLLGRTVASIRLFSRGALPLGAVTAGVLASVLAARTTVAVLMALLVVTPVLLRLSPLGRVRRTEQLAPSSS